MLYSDFKTIKSAEVAFGIVQQEGQFFGKITPYPPSQRLLEDLEEAFETSTITEKAKSEFIITPILKEVRRNNKGRLAIFSGSALDVNELLTGYCDYLLSKAVGKLELTAPLFCVVEAKSRAIEEGYGQCIAEMYAAQLFNERDGLRTPIMYGCVTTGYDWSFIKLENKIATIDNELFQIRALPELLGALQAVVDSF